MGTLEKIPAVKTCQKFAPPTQSHSSNRILDCRLDLISCLQREKNGQRTPREQVQKKFQVYLKCLSFSLLSSYVPNKQKAKICHVTVLKQFQTSSVRHQLNTEIMVKHIWESEDECC